MIFLGIDSCSADSGGPLMLESKEKGRKITPQLEL